MKIFKINEQIEIVCESKSTRSGFRHEATLMINGSEQEKTKICYQNRTWERYEFESVMLRLIEKSSCLSMEQKAQAMAFIKKDNTDWSMFKSVGMIAKLGDVFSKDKKEANDWKQRMIKAGLGNSGIEMPDDWDALDEETKEARLNKVIEHCMSVGKK